MPRNHACQIELERRAPTTTRRRETCVTIPAPPEEVTPLLVQQAVYEPLLPLPDVASDGAWSPQIDIRELPNEYIVLADLPGVEPEAVHVSTEKDRMTIEGARRDRLYVGGVPYRLERPTGKLRRTVRLPGPSEVTKIRTKIRDGVLEVRVPKRDDVGLTTEFIVEEQQRVGRRPALRIAGRR